MASCVSSGSDVSMTSDITCHIYVRICLLLHACTVQYTCHMYGTVHTYESIFTLSRSSPHSVTNYGRVYRCSHKFNWTEIQGWQVVFPVHIREIRNGELGIDGDKCSYTGFLRTKKEVLNCCTVSLLPDICIWDSQFYPEDFPRSYKVNPGRFRCPFPWVVLQAFETFPVTLLSPSRYKNGRLRVGPVETSHNFFRASFLRSRFRLLLRHIRKKKPNE